MGKVKTPKRNGSSGASPYDKSSKNNIFKFNKDYGIPASWSVAHILKNPGVSDAIVAKANLKPTDTVLEVGPGSGNLTVRILPQSKKLICVEIDPRMAAEVTKRVQGTPEHRKLEVLMGDVIKMEKLPAFDVLISNTPYQISSPLIFRILGMPKPPRTAVLMLQREFALRLVAQPGDPLYCRLSANAQLFAKVSHVLKVGKANFNPPPKVESSVVRIEPIYPRPEVSYEEWDGLLRIVFSRRNKTIRASFLTGKIMTMLERNYRTWASLHDVPLDDTVVAPTSDAVDEDEDMEAEGPTAADEGMEVDDDDDNDDAPEFFKDMQVREAAEDKTPSKRSKTKTTELVRNKVLGTLERTGLGEQRASKCDQSEFLRLLYEFNKEGIHFAS
ncbi:Dimethyladenosine transferase [Ceratocystis fimbriata CBS 114723]|uniref:rRNA adenine N(6)-methyltransferase n=1 Tax=Ceratocystis fimbriata CBS 114723 TaxID=1035309 RepID=A0A2C5X8V0_9PEZI|nr:Dimethyladenosine transferase [Ceratocystis fimbriata CBS 114723]